MRSFIFQNGNKNINVEYKVSALNDNAGSRTTVMDIVNSSGSIVALNTVGLGIRFPKTVHVIQEFIDLAVALNLNLISQIGGASHANLNVKTDLSITTGATLTAGTHSVAYGGVTLAATGGSYSASPSNVIAAPWALTGGTLPTGITLNTATGAITGTPNSGSAGTYNPIISYTDAYGETVSKTFTLVIA